MQLSSFFNDTLNRQADLSKEGDSFVCNLYYRNKIWKTIVITNHNEWYCEDLCENFVDGIGEFRALRNV